ncbi:TPA: hypothetical protein NGU08_004322 [Vibrio parahaemolyticus]|nr:hypothetical protein [Vibrio parahaemolyticus]
MKFLIKLNSLEVCLKWGGLFQVVSVAIRFESKPDLSASKHIKIMVSKWGLA